ncbi:DUF4149 domain-containing protein [Massilia glaciei]|uniref:DUF4149 domain-containing protein n=1 Tax=Massilia glaciei TaxID=1524097 RepID=A0A2U2HM98_9BURK|nr:DUF4149 domain-containing protein [Massilia glaciei]PWF48627.1 DUF4149 domain-containing protein [Massilia glaciei]
MLLSRVRLLVAALWAGSLWTVGYLVAPTAFASFERPMAGAVAAAMFHSEAMLSLGCGAAMLLLLFVAKGLDPKRRRGLMLLALAMLGCTLVSHFGLQPLMAALRAGSLDGVMVGDAKARFGMLHGVSSVIYLIQSVLAGWLLIKNAEEKSN